MKQADLGLRGRPPFAVNTLLRIHYTQPRWAPSAPAMKGV